MTDILLLGVHQRAIRSLRRQAPGNWAEVRSETNDILVPAAIVVRILGRGYGMSRAVDTPPRPIRDRHDHILRYLLLIFEALNGLRFRIA
jgi:hypothetical protein